MPVACVFFTSNRDTYARDEFEAKREKETREYAHTRAFREREYSIQNYSYKHRERVFGYEGKKRNNVYEREREREIEK